MKEHEHQEDEMGQQELAQRVVDNTLLTAINRVGMPLLAGFLVLIVIPVGAWYLNSTAQAISDIRDKSSALGERVTIVEANQRNGADRNAQAQVDLKASIATISQAQSKMSDQQTAILEELAGINATLKREVQP